MTNLSGLAHLAAGVAAVGAGLVNAVAGGGTLISFPVLTAIGVPAIRANATNTVALCPGYVGGTYAQRHDLAGTRNALRARMVAAIIGGLGGSVLLIVSSEAVFRGIVPFLILAACALLAVQDRLRDRVLTSTRFQGAHAVLEIGAVAIASVYGGYFGAGLGIMLMAVLGLFSELPFNKLNAVKQLLSVLVNVSAAAFLAVSGRVEWTLVAVMAPASMLGGHLGGSVASSLPPKKMRAAVIVLGIVVATAYLLR